MNDSIRITGQPEPYQELMGMFLREPELFSEYASELTPSHFKDLGWLYESMKQLDEEDALNMRELGIKHPLYVRTFQNLYGCVLSTRTAADKVRRMKDDALAFNLERMFESAVGDLQLGKDANDVYRDIMKSLDMVQTSDAGKVFNTAYEVEQWYRWIDEIRKDKSKAFGLMTGIFELDKMTQGFHRHDLSVIGARTSMGKSAFMLELVLRLTQKGYKTAIFSLEMTRKQILNRMTANLSRIPLQDVKTGDLDEVQFQRLMGQRSVIERVYIDDSRGVTADYITDMMRTLKRKDGLDFVVVDYLQDIKEKGEENDNQGSALGRVCRKLRKAALDCDCHIMALSQVKREVENRNDKRPMNSDLSGSTGIETSADVIGLLYRDEYYKPDTSKPGIIEVNFTKQRNGGVGRVELKYDKDIQRMSGQFER